MDSRRGIISETEIKKLIAGEVRFNEPMCKHTSFQIGGPADVFLIPQNLKELKRIVSFISQNALPLFILGEGTNLLVSDKGIRGVVIKLAKETFGKIKFKGEEGVIGASAKLSEVVERSIEENLEGLAFAAGIPGSIGGAMVMNAGIGSQSIGNLVEKVKVCTLQGEIIELPKEKLAFGYRESIFLRQPSIILEAKVHLQKGKKEEIVKERDGFLKERIKKQPLSFPNAGCIFKNPKDDFAGRLIELANLKGKRRGEAEVSAKHANFILNLGRAKAKDVFALIKEIRKKVKEKTGITLETEIQVVGEQ